jgi:hypothetical protein
MEVSTFIETLAIIYQTICHIQENIIINLNSVSTYCDGFGDTSEMNVATQRSRTDLVSPTQRFFRIHGARDR